MRHLIFILLLSSLVGCSGSSQDASPDDNTGATPDDDPGGNFTGLTSNNYTDVLRDSVDLLRGNHYQELVARLNVGSDTVWGGPFSQPSGESLEASCPEGGEYSRTEFYEDTGSGPISANLVELSLLQCTIDGAAITGDLSINATSEASRQGTTLDTLYTFSDLSVSTNELQQTMSATLAQNEGVFGFRQFYTVEFRSSSFVQEAGTELLSLTDSVYRQEYDHQQDTNTDTTDHLFQEQGSGIVRLTGATEFGGSIEMSPALVYMNEAAENNPKWTHTQNLASGKLQVTSIDGSYVQVTPNTGNPDTVNYMISSDGFQTLVEDFWFEPASSAQLP